MSFDQGSVPGTGQLETHNITLGKQPLKRRRGACESCKPKKVRCDGKTPCSACKRSGLQCLYHITKKRRRNTVRLPNVNSASTSKEPCTWASGESSSADVPVDISVSTRPLPWLSPGIEQTLSPSDACATLDMSSTVNDTICLNEEVLMAQPLENYDADWNTFFQANPLDMIQVSVAGQAQSRSPVADVDQVLQEPLVDCAIVESPTQLQMRQSNLPTHQEIALSTKSLEAKDTQYFGNAGEWELIPIGSGGRDSSFEFELSAESVFALDVANPALDKRTHTDIARLLRCLSPTQHIYEHPSEEILVESQTVLSHQDHFDQYLTACCDERTGIGSFLEKSYMGRVIRTMDDSKLDEQRVTMCLANAVLALGSHITAANGCKDSKLHLARSQTYFSKAMRLLDGCIYSKDTFVKFQALLALLSLSKRRNYQLTTGLLAQATQCARSLRLHSHRAIQAQFGNLDGDNRAKRAFWYLYTIDKAVCLTQGTFSTIDDESIDYEPPSRHFHENGADWLHTWVVHAKLLAFIVKELYNAKPTSRRVEATQACISRLQELLKTWKEILPPTYQRCIDSDDWSEEAHADPEQRRMKLQLSFTYHGALITMYGPVCRMSLDATAPNAVRAFVQRSEEVCLASSRTILRHGRHLNAFDVLGDTELLHPVLAAICTVFRAILKNPAELQKDIAYLALGCGIFGTMSLEFNTPLEQILELIHYAHSSVHSKNSCIGSIEQ